MTTTQSDSDIKAWFTGRLPQEWTGTAPTITIDREEITVLVRLDPVELGDDATDEAKAEAASGRISGWREESREARMTVAREAQRRFERKVSWGATWTRRLGPGPCTAATRRSTGGRRHSSYGLATPTRYW